MTSVQRWAYLTAPGKHGVFTVFRTLRKELSPHGIDLTWLAAPIIGVENDSIYRASCREGCLVHGEDDPARARWAIEFIEREEFVGVIGNGTGGATFEGNLLRYLPRSIARILLVHSSSVGTSRYVKTLLPYVHQVIAISPRLYADVKQLSGGKTATRLELIPNGLTLESQLPRPLTNHDDPLRILMLGRVSQKDKDVFALPRMLALLGSKGVHVTVAGDGKDLDELRRRCKSVNARVEFTGWVDAKDVPVLCASQDVIYLPSITEGLPYSLIEAMGYGCVAVASYLPGVTDFIVKEGVTGFLVGAGDYKTAAERIGVLINDRTRLQTMARAAGASIREKFSARKTAVAYSELMREIIAQPSPIAEPLPLSDWGYDRDFGGSIRRLVPEPLKDRLRRWRQSSRFWGYILR
jgi:glycosyltransferase involved in cell wall biosynthesis